ncbi:MAG: hypothetical protein NC209_02255 [Alistipes sp.]|nr:hypothetical protein [Alistipes senegalensis]MCM1249951.1 hypothetical protein [Alistipes sp.]
MNKKTFILASMFLCITLVWLGANVYWRAVRPACVSGFDLAVAVLFVAVAAGMTVHEFRKKKRRHLEDVNKHQIP